SIELLEQTHSDEAGRFELVGRSRSNSVWRPVLNIYHDCEDAKNRVFDLGAWNLQTSVKEDEERVDKITRRRRRGGEKPKYES
ncbi:hypothetical protein ANCDUO_15777, partial [Ancylostoma duodenale]